MYVTALSRYRVPIEVIKQHTDAHRAYLKGLKDEGKLLAAGPFDPRAGGLLIFRLPDGTPWDEIVKLRDDDPFIRHGVAQYELQVWNPVLGRDGLDTLR